MIAAILVPLLVVSTIAGLVLLWLFGRIAAHWGAVRSVVTASALPPALLWLIALGVDVQGAAHHRLHPHEPFMGGLSIVSILPLSLCFLVTCVATAIASARRAGDDPLRGPRRRGDGAPPHQVAPPSRQQLRNARAHIVAQLDELRFRAQDRVGGAAGPPAYGALVATLEDELRDIDALLGPEEEPTPADRATKRGGVTEQEKAWLRKSDIDRRLHRKSVRKYDAMNAALATAMRRAVRVISIFYLAFLLAPLLHASNWSIAFGLEIGRSILILLAINVGVSAFAWLLRSPRTVKPS